MPLSAAISRRHWLSSAAGGALGLSLGSLLQARAAGSESASDASAGAPPIRACILVFYYGGPSHLETFDPKPDAPADVRGEFKPISTSVPGLAISEHLPKLSRWMHKAAIIRSMSHQARLHDSASIHVLTGRPLEGPDRELFSPLPQFYPSFGGAVAYMQRHAGRVLPFAALPYEFHNVVTTPAQGGGFLGAEFDPLRIEADPANLAYQVKMFQPADDLGIGRMAERRGLLETLDPAATTDRRLREQLDRAFRLLSSQAIREAVDITREPLATREQYGLPKLPLAPGPTGNGGHNGFARELRGQNLLLARRLVEAGVPFVNVYDFRQQGQNWDSHADNFGQHKEFLLPPADQALAALIEDLDQRGLLDTTLVVALGEFGRTPKINAQGGRDHWPDCYSVLLAGGGVTGGAVYGASDRIGAYPAVDPATPGDLAATIYWRFGLDPAAEIHDQSGRPHRLAGGEPIKRLFGAG
ncbi:MAG: DUF1501 domain-containing protein [Pirellulaceae bacterium]|nr:DUF1501 domain-containing protein [Pirellulaceae bacterium]